MDRGADPDEYALSLLDDAERARAGRFVAARDRAAYVAHHVFTRRVLSRYLDVAPGDVAMRSTRNGKPEIEAACGIMFNSSRSGGLSLVAMARERVGVDVERMRPIDDALELAGLFADGEQDSLRRASKPSRDTAFLALWTRKESVVKAFGTGLSVPLDSFKVGMTPADDPSAQWRGKFGGEPFVVAPFATPHGWMAAVCVAGTRLDVRSMDAAILES